MKKIIYLLLVVIALLGIGIYALINKPNGPTPPPSFLDETTECIIKGNISSSGERIYHVPGGSFYDQTKIDTSNGERWFCSEEEARQAGWRKSLR
ncbi:MAG: hypothetical protein Q8P77_01050 [Candidatus Veblenbacteria bacterium]|nr:hypothetical protein [Candidatus Veblenbacteria bacterium]